jgi:DNA mismatch repair protein MutS2
VDKQSLAVLEYPAIVERLAAATATPRGAELAAALEPSDDPEEVGRRQALTAESIDVLDAAAEPDLGGVADVREAATQAGRGAMVGPRDLRAIAVSVVVGLAGREALHEQRDRAPLLYELVAPVDPTLGAVADAIARHVEDDGSDLRDGASPLLRRLRRELGSGKQRVADELRRLARNDDLRTHLQEEFVTERGGRPVLAVRAGARGKVPGIVHDASSSGQTLFVEPFSVVELNNRLSEAASAEREEVERILRELSGLVGERSDALQALVEAIADLDLALARGMLSRRWRGAPVEIGDEVRLLDARHPLLEPATAVPIDLDLGGLRALVVSGPNTGGKTVALKTLGLAALLHQAGLRPPAEHATLPVFDGVLADIGDQQSIAMSLSTFSGHVRSLVAVLEAATDRSLVLLDELASGTDPVEGSALAQALVARLARQARLTAVTTHHPELKEWASATDEVANAGTGFDPETHAPLYRPALGRPGASHALQIAERLGLDPGIVADARARIAPERLRIAELLAEAEAAERAAAGALADAGRERDEAARLGELARERADALDLERERVKASAERAREQAIAAAELELADARAELGALRDEIRSARRREQERRRAAPPAARAAERDRDRRLGAAATRSARAEQALSELEPQVPEGPLAVGDPVQAPSLGVVGTIASVEGQQAEVLGPGGLRIRVPLAQLRSDPRGAHGAVEPPEPAVRVVASARADVPDELDVRGRRAHEAREAVTAFVDEAALAGLPVVRVIHGRGTGAVRGAVREELVRHPLVERHEPDSADGATLVHLGGSGPSEPEPGA